MDKLIGRSRVGKVEVSALPRGFCLGGVGWVSSSCQAWSLKQIQVLMELLSWLYWRSQDFENSNSSRRSNPSAPGPVLFLNLLLFSVLVGQGGMNY